jgi:hypothetical protein
MDQGLESLKLALLNGELGTLLAGMPADALAGAMPALAAEKLDLYCWPWIKELPQLDLSAPIWQRLRQDYLLEQAYLRYRMAEIQQLEQILPGIPHIVLKGPALLCRLGRTQAYKRSDDLDILVRKADAQRVISRLTNAGYHRLESKTNGEFSMMRDKNTTLDIHYEITASSPFIHLARLALEPFFAASERVMWQDSPMRILCPSHGLIHLVIHFAVNHQFNEFILLLEIGEYLRQYQSKFNWPRLIRYLQDNVLAEAFYICVALLQALGETALAIRPQDFVPQADRARALDAWMQANQLLAHLLSGRRNPVETNDFPRFCANTPRKLARFNQGNLAWVKGEYV